MKALYAPILAVALFAAPAFGQEEKEDMASADEMTKVNVTLEKVGCKAVEV